MNDKLDCWVCGTEMKFIEIIHIVILGGKCRKYECPECGEIVNIPCNKIKCCDYK